MNRISKHLLTGLTAGLATGALALGASAQPIQGLAAPMPLIQTVQLSQQPQNPQMPQEMPRSQAARTSTFTGTIVKAGSGYALRDSSGTVYQIDDSSQASRFAGKEVKIVGQLDPQTHTIHVSSIEGGS